MPKGRNYKEQREYESCLRRIVLESGDILPDDVAAYLNDCAGSGLDDEEQALLTHYGRIAAHLPRAYADAVIKILVETDFEEYDALHHSYDFFDDLGIQRGADFFPPAPVQGPFLHLLRVNEEQGLRLVQTLANTAIRNWRRRERMNLPHSPSETPIPVILQFEGGETRKFWGDEDVYRWFRPLTRAPNAVVSALMALEMWMEEQLEGGRSADDLFSAVLRDAECLAIVGLCLGVAMAYPVRCLRAALPLVSSPRIWSYDVNRLVQDSHDGSPNHLFPRWRHIDEILKERGERPQRRVDIRQFVMTYMHGPDKALRDAFVAAVSRFSLESAYSFEEQKTDGAFNQRVPDLLSRFQAIANLSNYRETRTPDGGVRMTFQLPEQITAGDEAFLTSYAENDRALSVMLWADKSLKQRREVEGYTVPEAMKTLEAISLATGIDDETMFVRHMQAAGVGVLALGFIVSSQWMKTQNLFEEGTDALMRVAVAPVPVFEPYVDKSRHPFCKQVYAIHGLFAILKEVSLDVDVRQRIRELLLTKAADSSLQIVEAVLENVGRIWKEDPILCRSVVTQVLALSLLPRCVCPLALHAAEFVEWKRRMRDESLANLRDGVTPPFPRMNNVAETYFADQLGALALNALPPELLADSEEAEEQLISLADELIERRMAELHDGDIESRHRNQCTLQWIAKLTRLVPEEASERWFGLIRDCWPTAPQLTLELLDGFITSRLIHEDPPTPQTLQEWNTICHWITSVPLSELPSGQTRQDALEAIGVAVFTRFRMCHFDPTWPHARLFQTAIEHWVGAFGGDESAYTDLLVMLATLGHHFEPQIQIDWLNECQRKAGNLKNFVAATGERTARLLATILERTNSLDGMESAQVTKFAHLVDTLVANGIAIAAPLQNSLNS